MVNLFKRKRFVLYLEVLNGLYAFFRAVSLEKSAVADVSLFDVSCFSSEDEKHFARILIERFIAETQRVQFRIKVLTTILRFTHLKIIFAIDDVRHYNDLLIAGKVNGITTITIQHGHFTKYHVGWLKDSLFEGGFVVPDTLLVWSQYWKDELLRLGTHFEKEAIVIGGSKDSIMTREPKKKMQDCVVLIPYETSGPQGEVARYIENILKCEDISVIFKLRSDIPEAKQLAEYGLLQIVHPKFKTEVEIKEVINSIDLVIGTYSTFLYDMLASGVRIAMLKTESDYGEGMVINNLADMVSNGENSCEELHLLCARPPQEIEDRRVLLMGEHQLFLADTLADIIEKVKL